MRSDNTLDRIMERESKNFRPFRYTVPLDLRPFDDNMPDFGRFAEYSDDVSVNNVTVIVEQMLDQPMRPELTTPTQWRDLPKGYSWWAAIAPQTLLRLCEVYPGETTMEDIVNTAQKTFVDTAIAREPEFWARYQASAQRMSELYGITGVAYE